MEELVRPTILLIVIILAVRLSTPLCKRFGLPTATVQLLLGVLLGPSLLNLLDAPIILGIWGSPSPGSLHTVLKILGEIGLIQLMFLAGLQTDWHDLKRMLKPIFSVGALGFVLTAIIVVIIARCFVDHWAEALAVGAIMAASSFGMMANNFYEMKFFGSWAANMILGVAALSGVLAILLMIASLATNYGMTYGGFRMIIAVSWFMGKLVMFFAVAYFLASRFLKLITKSALEKRPRQMLIGYLLLIASLYAWAAAHFGSFAAVYVASLGGALLGMSNFDLKEKVEKGMESVLVSLPVGVLFMVLGMEANLKVAKGYLPFLAVLFVAVIGVKLVGYWIATRRASEPLDNRFLIMIGTLPQGEIGILIAAYLFSRGVVNPSQFNIMAIVVVILTMLTPILMKVAPVQWRERETIVTSPITKREKR